MSGAPCPFCGAPSAGPLPGAACEGCLRRFARREEERALAGEYELFEALGEGATGTVHRAEHRVTGEVVAIKLAKPEFLAEPAAAKLFLRQARTESLLRHPHIVGVQGTGTYAGRPFLVMPWMEGGTLADAATLKRFPSLEQRLALMIKIARAVQFAHERGVLHCDLKPENILFDAADEARALRSLGSPGSRLGRVRCVGARRPAAVRPPRLREFAGQRRIFCALT